MAEQEMDHLLALGQKETRDRAIRDAIGQGLRLTYDVTAPMPDRLVTLLSQLSGVLRDGEKA
jgi:hypothetical protein